MDGIGIRLDLILSSVNLLLAAQLDQRRQTRLANSTPKFHHKLCQGKPLHAMRAHPFETIARVSEEEKLGSRSVRRVPE